MHIANDRKSLSEKIKEYKSRGDKITLIPTMGNLHQGHISLIDLAKQYENEIISSIFINRLQFNEKNDYEKYPKSLESDIELLEKNGCDYLLIPDESILDNIKLIKAPSKSKKLCGKNRPGHFDGVLTILNKFFKIINPEISIFGKKDYQQFLLVKEFVIKNCLNIKIIGGDTIREDSGLALSSRNNLLSEKEKHIASSIYKVLCDIESSKNLLNKELLENKKKYLTKLGFEVDYLTICNALTLEDSFSIDTNDLLVAVAAKLGEVRLIDNILLTKL